MSETIPLLASDQELLGILRWASNEDLEPLVEYITKKGDLTESLTATEGYRQYRPDHKKYVEAIAAEIQVFGANTFRTMVRGHGVCYQSILKDVAKKLKVKRRFRTVQQIERDIHFKVLGAAYGRANEQQRREMLEALGVNVHRDLQGRIPAVLPVVAQTAIASGGFLPYQVAVIVANGAANAVIGHGLSFAGNAMLTKSLSVFAGPIGWAISALLIMNSLFAGPAYRVTVPAVIHISYLSAKKQEQEEEIRRAQRLRRFKIAALSTAILVLLIAIAVVITMWRT
jgi:uncharacterized protein YaaW (UPF0174 family)